MRLPPLVSGTLLGRYKRFLADVRLDDGETVTAHCPNTGSMLGLNISGSRVWLSRSENPRRKLAYTWELVETAAGVRVGIHTGRANGLVAEALENGLLPELAGHTGLIREAPLSPHSRTDFLLKFPDRVCWVEVKSVTAAADHGTGFFPDAASARAVRHLHELTARVAAGERAALVFCVQRGDVSEVRPADDIDPAFGHTLRVSGAAGVELYALGARVDTDGILLERRLRVELE